MPDRTSALTEVFRVLRPGGRLHFWEQVRAERPGPARVQRLVDAAIWPLIGGGCHSGRDTLTGPTMPAPPQVIGMLGSTEPPTPR